MVTIVTNVKDADGFKFVLKRCGRTTDKNVGMLALAILFWSSAARTLISDQPGRLPLITPHAICLVSIRSCKLDGLEGEQHLGELSSAAEALTNPQDSKTTSNSLTIMILVVIAESHRHTLFVGASICTYTW
jgi:hypothetical protein